MLLRPAATVFGSPDRRVYMLPQYHLDKRMIPPPHSVSGKAAK
jgi:hypothetical protein